MLKSTPSGGDFMRLGPFGPLEIALIIVVIMVVLILTRILRTRDGDTGQNKGSPPRAPGKSVGAGTTKMRPFLKRSGIALALIGAVLLFASLSLFRWAFQSYLWSFIIMAAGIALFFLSRKK